MGCEVSKEVGDWKKPNNGERKQMEYSYRPKRRPNVTLQELQTTGQLLNRTFTSFIPQNHPESDDVFSHYVKIKEIGEGSTCTIWAVKSTKPGHIRHDQLSSNVPFHDEPVSEQSSLLKPVSIVPEDGTHDEETEDKENPHKKERMYALKEVQKGEMTNPVFLTEMKNEIDILKTMDHPNIFRIYEKFESATAIHLISELCTGGDLYSKAPYTEGQAAHILTQVLSALTYMHKRYIIHRDIKFENSSYQVKLIDFGLARTYMYTSSMTERVGTVFTMAPEVINGRYTKQADLWSTGVIAYMVLAGGCRDDDIRPFDGATRKEVAQHILHDKVIFKGKLWKHVSKGGKHFVSSLLVEPQKRPSASKALHSEWLVRQEGLYQLAKSIDEVHHMKKDAFRASVNHALIKSKEFSRFKKMALMVIAYDSTLEEIQGLKEIFAEYDTDGDGIISYQEFRDAITKDRDTPHLEEKEIETVFQGLDVNKTGVIDYTEFLAATLEARGQVEVDYIAKAFDRFDMDSSGYISRENLYTLFQKSRSKDFDESIITDIFGNDEKKQISYKEFLSLFQDEQFVRVEKAVENLSPT
eukprot:scaffold89990_cov60-Attheya_sp.AAC.2